MKTLAETKENNSIKNRSAYQLRESPRAVLLDDSNNIALLFVSKDNYHKLPGGRVEEGEDLKLTLKRELREETGCECKMVAEVGKIIEYRDESKLKQISFCYLAKVDGVKGEPSFTEKEKALGFELKWVPIDKVLELTEKDSLKRDSIFIKEAKKIIREQ